MKKLFRFLTLAVLFAVSGCQMDYDDSELVGRIDNLESRVERLEQLCQQMNNNISSLQAIVNALQMNDYITDVEPIIENGITIGYTISFAKAQPITIYHGEDGEDGYTPQIGVKQDSEGIYYWTIDGKWLLDDAGNKIQAAQTDGNDAADGKDDANGKDGEDGIAPQLKIENDYWYVSYDNGATWTQLGKATGDNGKDGDSFFQSVTQDDSNVYFTLADGTILTLPKGQVLSIEFAEDDLVGMFLGSIREIGYTVTSVTDTVKVEVTSSADIKAKVVAEDESGLTGKIHVITGDAIDEYSKVIVFVSNGDRVIMRSIAFEEAGLVVADNAIKQASADGGEVTLEFLSNVECQVIIPENAHSWISEVPASRAMERQTITLKLEPNEGAARLAEVAVKTIEGDLSLTYTVKQDAHHDYQLQLEREALIAIYKALDGDNWLHNDNWCSDRPVGEWYGITTNQMGFVESVYLSEYTNMKGVFPIEICELEYLEELYLCMSHISGPIPDEISNLKNLRRLYLPGDGSDGNKSECSLPKSIYSLKKLYEITIQSKWVTFEITDEISELTELEILAVKLCHNSTISSNIKNCTKLRELMLFGDGTQSIPEEIYQLKELTSLFLYNLKGSISESIGELQKLTAFGISGSNITGVIPDAIGYLHNMQQLSIKNTEISGSIPKGLFTASAVSYIIDLSNNKLSGSIPSEVTTYLSNNDSYSSKILNLGYNRLSGDIPIEVQRNPRWYRVWPHIILTNSYDLKDLYLPGPKLLGEDVYGNPIDSETEYEKYDYTILWQISPNYAINSMYAFSWFYMKELYNKYKTHNIQVLYLGDEYNSENELIEFKENYDVPFRVFSTNRNMGKRLTINRGDCTTYLPTMWKKEGAIGAFGEDEFAGIGNQVNVIDKHGNVVFMGAIDGSESGLELFLAKALGNAESELYQSVEYARDEKNTTDCH